MNLHGEWHLNGVFPRIILAHHDFGNGIPCFELTGVGKAAELDPGDHRIVDHVAPLIAILPGMIVPGVLPEHFGGVAQEILEVGEKIKIAERPYLASI